MLVKSKWLPLSLWNYFFVCTLGKIVFPTYVNLKFGWACAHAQQCSSREWEPEVAALCMLVHSVPQQGTSIKPRLVGRLQAYSMIGLNVLLLAKRGLVATQHGVTSETVGVWQFLPMLSLVLSDLPVTIRLFPSHRLARERWHGGWPLFGLSCSNFPSVRKTHECMPGNFPMLLQAAKSRAVC